MDASCWQGNWTFISCCYSIDRRCFDGVYTFERCCAQDARRARNDILEFAAEWTPFTALVANFTRGGLCQYKLKLVTARWDLFQFARLLDRFFRMSGDDVCGKSHRESLSSLPICSPRVEFWRCSSHFIRRTLRTFPNTSSDDVHLFALDMIAASHTADLAVASAISKEVDGGYGCSPEDENAISAIMKSVWRRTRPFIFLDRQPIFAQCGCAGPGHDLYMIMKAVMKDAGLSHPDFSKNFVDPTSRAHHYIMGQSCKKYAPRPERDLLKVASTVKFDSCPAGEAATDILTFHRCLLDGMWANALSKLFRILATVIACPKVDNFARKMWGFSADDILYNVARFVGEVDADVGVERTKPLAAQVNLAWRRAPDRIFYMIAEERKEILEFNGNICVVDGAIALPAGVVVDVSFCTEWGCTAPPLTWMGPTDWNSLISAIQTKPADHILFAFAIAYPHPNIWHALHWWVPALSMKRKRRWKRDKLHLALTWGNHAVQQNTVDFYSSIFSILSSSEPYVLDQYIQGKPACFQSAVLGIPSFQYDFQIPMTTKTDLALFRKEMSTTFTTRPASTPQKHYGESSQNRGLHVLVLQRPSGHRRIVNMESLLRQFALIPTYITLEVRMESLSLSHQADLANRTDVLIGTHGAGLAWMAMMPPGGAVIEIMPKILPGMPACTGNWNHVETIYGALANICGHRYACIKSGGDLVSYDPTVYANFREGDVQAPVGALVRLLSQLPQFEPRK